MVVETKAQLTTGGGAGGGVPTGTHRAEEQVLGRQDCPPEIRGESSSGLCLRAQSCLTVTPRTAALQAPLSTGFPKQGNWSGLPLPTTRDLPDPGV